MPQHDAGHDYKHPADLVPRLCAVIHSEGFPNGTRARLKRMVIGGPTPLAYHRFAIKHIPERWQGAHQALAWRTLIGAIAGQHQNPHTPETSFGRSLANCGYSENRLESLLAAEGRVLATLALRATMRLGVQRARCNWRDVAWLLFATHTDSRERINRRIASDFYRAQAANNSNLTEAS